MPTWRRDSRGAENRVWLVLVLALALALIPLHPAALKARPRLADRRPAGLYLVHPRLARTVPAEGDRLTSAPTALRLTFTEVPELTFTRLTLIGPAGDTVRLHPPVDATDDDHTVVAAIEGAVPPGQFTVIWQTAGPDAHPIRGRYSFMVATAGTAGAAPDRAGQARRGRKSLRPGRRSHPRHTTLRTPSTTTALAASGPNPPSLRSCGGCSTPRCCSSSARSSSTASFSTGSAGAAAQPTRS